MYTAYAGHPQIALSIVNKVDTGYAQITSQKQPNHGMHILHIICIAYITFSKKDRIVFTTYSAYVQIALCIQPTLGMYWSHAKIALCKQASLGMHRSQCVHTLIWFVSDRIVHTGYSRHLNIALSPKPTRGIHWSHCVNCFILGMLSSHSLLWPVQIAMCTQTTLRMLRSQCVHNLLCAYADRTV